MEKQIVIFCDFDGTITEKDNIINIMQHFVPEEQWKPIVDDIFAKKRSLRNGVYALFQLVPSSLRREITDFVLSRARIRDGFGEFVDYCHKQNIKLLVTSNGIDFFIEPLLSPYAKKIDTIYCNKSNFSGENVEIIYPYPCDEHCNVDCGMCKTTIIRKYKSEKYFKVVIGDSITDLEGAKITDTVIARSYLAEKCQELGIKYKTFSTFHDCIEALDHLIRRTEVTQ
ncbi:MULTISPECIES: 2-hydroxy-3-keto-5-methylthiopentenyl-1-phosphate phosphatase [Aneurinibacillus]|jgi:2-hydroxy-3-keto-5-methylthiopentenyl-1-phosphate phosphatase|uniref:2-hydroxy-3-keto-5-methylthiopentenyl-1-phosphate phosphatase n=1 Tax=Aneurinibacillus thermoaerophilus TaxID=143495 RepID=A0A1G8A856_ANETH|nr:MULTISPECIES: 2-hydroxy-3-keto-5-methylthiopentenyl-1-phosphate phosphatase [Aneurinibacillus]AMA74069.1 2-hydroxy-3-keto-5-methylthiopentenyl-1-phosphate phosphatase [Aneurinibacillus sp. XH2]MED0675441.1 2-hydroxy-3-keto-5-methylthiopentenyl-1-phosphate phosphatase [Aneurinibacillus thermoaerophilus]MED0678795.1 2-hydroxy-3-keto-5-methylthiopentenyl-1-phosphate phosphatase [Aneurinibacillus thermoaerophilus]MED0736669.1 2-hydroxy-3-keto-5-methylthiopentenyl-1-phosphate phosphatase [Aneurin